MPDKSQAKLLFKFEKFPKAIFQYIQMEFFKLFFILQMLGIVTNVFGHQESIFSWTLKANNGGFKVDLAILIIEVKIQTFAHNWSLIVNFVINHTQVTLNFCTPRSFFEKTRFSTRAFA